VQAGEYDPDVCWTVLVMPPRERSDVAHGAWHHLQGKVMGSTIEFAFSFTTFLHY